VAHGQPAGPGGGRRRVVLEHPERRLAVRAEVGDHGVVPGGGQRDVAGVDGDLVAAGHPHLELAERLPGQAAEVLRGTELEVLEHGLAAGDDVDGDAGDPVEQMDARRRFLRMGRGGRRQDGGADEGDDEGR
jgi:hypothetical protein